jgi:capsular polysaccharide biosynthesis protein
MKDYVVIILTAIVLIYGTFFAMWFTSKPSFTNDKELAIEKQRNDSLQHENDSLKQDIKSLVKVIKIKDQYFQLIFQAGSDSIMKTKIK